MDPSRVILDTAIVSEPPVPSGLCCILACQRAIHQEGGALHVSTYRQHRKHIPESGSTLTKFYPFVSLWIARPHGVDDTYSFCAQERHYQQGQVSHLKESGVYPPA